MSFLACSCPLLLSQAFRAQVRSQFSIFSLSKSGGVVTIGSGLDSGSRVGPSPSPDPSVHLPFDSPRCQYVQMREMLLVKAKRFSARFKMVNIGLPLSINNNEYLMHKYLHKMLNFLETARLFRHKTLLIFNKIPLSISPRKYKELKSY